MKTLGALSVSYAGMIRVRFHGSIAPDLSALFEHPDGYLRDTIIL